MSLPVDKLVILGFNYEADQLSGIYLRLKEKEINTKRNNPSFKPTLFIFSPTGLMIKH